MPIRFYKRVKLGKSNGIFISPGSAKMTKTERRGCSALLYYGLIAWWWLPIKWAFNQVRKLFNKTINLIARKGNLSLNMSRLVAVLGIFLLCIFCGLASYIYSLTPAGQLAAEQSDQTQTAALVIEKAATIA